VFLPCTKGYARYNHPNYKNSGNLASGVSEADHLFSSKSFMVFLTSPHKGQVTAPNDCSFLLSEQQIIHALYIDFYSTLPHVSAVFFSHHQAGYWFKKQ